METDRDREIPGQLAEYGMEVAAALKAQIVTASDADCADRLSLAFTRVSRSIRQTLAFKAKLAEMKAKSAEKRQVKEREQAIEASRLKFKKQQVARDVAEMVDSQSGSENLLTDSTVWQDKGWFLNEERPQPEPVYRRRNPRPPGGRGRGPR